MANRFERLFQLPEKQYVEGSPVILAAGALSKDTETGSIIAQLKFQSVSEKRIKAVKVSLTAYDVSKAEVQGVTDYQYLELNVGNGQEFGSNKAIVMPVSVTRSFAVASILVVFNDGSMWESAGDFTVLPTAKALSLGGAELEKQYRIATSDSATYAPAENQGLWQCACGTWNKSATCTHCRLLKSKVFSALDVTTLTEQMNIRLAKEQEQREAEAARQAQLQAEAEVRRKKNKKRLTIVAIIALVAAILLTAGIVIYNKVTELTIEKMLALYTKEDAVALLGKPDEDSNVVQYDVSFMGDEYSLMLTYSDGALKYWTMMYSYPGVDKLESVLDIPDYTVTAKDKAAASAVVSELTESFKEKYGEPQVDKSEKSTTTYTWVVNDRMIEVIDYTGNRDLSLVSAVSIRVNCDHQSFCKHTDTKAEHLDATCTENGYDRTICTICGYVDETTIIALGHNQTTTITKEPTCAVEGEKTHECSLCGFKQIEAIALLPHNYQAAVTKAPTCTVEGIKTHTCTNCGHATEETIATIAHIYKDTITKQPTCSAEGIRTSVCSMCGESTEASISKIAHNYEETVAQQASCTTAGIKVQKCSVCGTTTNSVTIPATGHNYVQYAIDAATCTAKGTRYIKCSSCGDEYTTAINALGHDWVDATCTKEKHCKNCNAVDGNPLGHDWRAPLSVMGTPYCNRCNADYTFNTKIVTNIPCTLTTTDGTVVTISKVWYECKVKANYGDDKFNENGGCRITIHIEGTATDSFLIETYAKLYASNGNEIDDILSSHGFTYPDSNGNFTEWFSYDIPAIADTYTFVAKIWKQTD